MNCDQRWTADKRSPASCSVRSLQQKRPEALAPEHFWCRVVNCLKCYLLAAPLNPRNH